jgi:NAD(P)-dependent dehydrogenase (short-subunit alcohol dehydrogenase family)
MSSPVVLITGALTGIGRATAAAFAKNGAHVVASGRREAEGKALETELRSVGAEAAFIAADVRHEDDVRSVIVEPRSGHLVLHNCRIAGEKRSRPRAEEISVLS